MMRYESLEDAMINGDNLAESVMHVIESQNPDEKFSDGNGGEITLLHYMVMAKLESGVSVMLEIGADPDVRSSNGMPPLITAVMLKDFSITRLLVEGKADVNIQELDYGDTPLLLALFNNDIEIAMYLLNHGANPNQCNFYGMAPNRMENFNTIRKTSSEDGRQFCDRWAKTIPVRSSGYSSLSFLLLSQVEMPFIDEITDYMETEEVSASG